MVQVMRYGWSKEAVRAAAEELGRPSVVAGLVKVPITRPSALGMSDPVMESLEILGAPEFSNL